MTNLYLIAHKVRSQPAFDIAHRMECPECHGDVSHDIPKCVECDELGYWWIIPTSGHRAYPWWWTSFDLLQLADQDDTHMSDGFDSVCGPMPPDLPDHYPTRSAPTISLLDALGLRKPKAGVENSPTQPIARRF